MAIMTLEEIRLQINNYYINRNFLTIFLSVSPLHPSNEVIHLVFLVWGFGLVGMPRR